MMLCACKQKDAASHDSSESKQAKALLQGIWVDSETQNVIFQVKGDTIFYPDSVSQPAYFRIVEDTMILGDHVAKYPLIKQTEHIFWFQNQNGDIIKLQKSEEEADSLSFTNVRPHVLTISQVTKTDTVVNFDNQRYHCYVAINPTKNKVQSTSYSEDGVEVSNVYYDNIVHVSVFHGNQRLFGKNFQKAEFSSYVSEDFLKQAVLSNVEYQNTDDHGLHFHATLCTPNAASCYLVEIVISFKGKYNMKLIEY